MAVTVETRSGQAGAPGTQIRALTYGTATRDAGAPGTSRRASTRCEGSRSPGPTRTFVPRPSNGSDREATCRHPNGLVPIPGLGHNHDVHRTPTPSRSPHVPSPRSASLLALALVATAARGMTNPSPPPPPPSSGPSIPEGGEPEERQTHLAPAGRTVLCQGLRRGRQGHRRTSRTARRRTPPRSSRGRSRAASRR